MELQLTSRAVAALLVRTCSTLTPVAKAAARHERALARVFMRAVKEAQDAVPMQDLVDVLSLGHPGTGASLYVLEPVIQMMLEETPREIEHRPYVRAAAEGGTVAGVLGAALASGAEATETCVREVFVFHGTPAENLASIKEHGLRPNEYGNPLNFHHIEESSRYYAGPDGVMLRVRVSDIPGGKSDLTQRTWTLSTIPPEKLEIWLDGKWQPLVKGKR